MNSTKLKLGIAVSPFIEENAATPGGVTGRTQIFPCHKGGLRSVTHGVTAADADADLVDRLRRCDRAAFRELYARFAQPTFAFLLRLARRRDAAEDLQQETWLAVARHAARLAPDSDLGAWIFTVARNQFRSWRRRAPEPAAGGDAAAELAAAHHPVASAGAGDVDLERALAALPEAHREILLLVGVEGLSTDRAAQVLAIRPDAARQRLARARAALAEALRAADADPEPQRGAS
jgi:RNA polymerase sigma-70 factor (ECF subfamily)